MSKEIYPCLWFEGNAKEAAEHYCSIFKNSKITSENQFVVNIELNGAKFTLLNGRVKFVFNESVSFVISCDTQDEIDHYWNSLSKGGSEGQCGWLKDKYGVSWQIVPTILGELLADQSKSQRVVEAFMKMTKFDIEVLKNA